ncbi:MAG TPA: CoA transferase [Thermohalobaculum sp.]|nr:CoA transferase [Thermohalobaculum sp.]
MAAPLEGIRVVDLTSMVSGPLATMTLADQGADVIKVEHPKTGDFARSVAGRRGGFSAAFLNNNRGKRSVALDLKDPRGVEAVLRLAAGADVFVQNFRPGVAERLGLGEAAVRTACGDIVYCSIAGFGFEGPYAAKPVFDPLIQALSGLASVQAGSDDARPRLVRTILPDKLTGVQAAQAISAALFRRERTGQGAHIRLSMLDTLMAFLWSSDMVGHTFVGDEPEEERSQSFIDLIYETADGHISVAAMHDRNWRDLAEALDRPDFLEDERFRTAEGREVHKDARLELTQAALAGLTTAEATERLEAHDVPCAPVLTRTEARRHPQIGANAILVEYDHPQAGRIRQARTPARFAEGIGREPRPAPLLGADTRAVLECIGYDAGEIEALIADGVAVDAREMAG